MGKCPVFRLGEPTSFALKIKQAKKSTSKGALI